MLKNWFEHVKRDYDWGVLWQQTPWEWAELIVSVLFGIVYLACLAVGVVFVLYIIYFYFVVNPFMIFGWGLAQ